MAPDPPEHAPSRPRKGMLPTFTDRIFSGITDILPDWLAGPWRDKQRSLLVAERKLQRRFLLEYRAQVKGLEPVLRERGNLVGTAIINAFAEHNTNDVTYQAAERSSAASFQQGGYKELLQTLDPLISPVLSPFVEGLRAPIDAALSGIEGDIKRTLAATVAVSLLTGIVIGSVASRRRGGGDR